MSKGFKNPSPSQAGVVAAVLAVAAALSCSSPAHAGQIITFGDNANSCGGAVICSSDGTTGYCNTNHCGQAFDLSTISQWFQIDVDGVNHLSNQSMAEPDKGAGGFLVVNDTGATIYSWSITLTDNFNANSPNAQPCGVYYCETFQANKGAAVAHGTEELSGPDFYGNCSGTQSGNTCTNTSGSNVTAKFKQGQVTYTWYFGTAGIAAGQTFDISFASWDGTDDAWSTTVPEPGSLALIGTALVGLGGSGLIRRRRKSAKA